MPLTVKIGLDKGVLGEYRLRDGKIEVVAGTDEAREDLDRRLDGFIRSMVMDHGVSEGDVTAEKVLRWIPGHSAQGRNWTELVESASESVSEGAPGPPPRPGLVWNDGTKRWTRPADAKLGGKPADPRESLARFAASAPDAETKDYLESALHNSDGTPEDTAAQLASVWKAAFDKGKGTTAGHVAKVLAHFGGELRGEPGAEVPFDPLSQASASPLSTGERVRVVRPAAAAHGKVIVKALVEPA